MRDRNLQQNRDKTVEAGNVKEPPVAKEANVNKWHERLQDQVNGWQKRNDHWQNEQENALIERHDQKLEELLREHAKEATDDLTASGLADRAAEMDTLERFQEIQRQQLEQSQQLTKTVFEEQFRAVNEFQEQQPQQERRAQASFETLVRAQNQALQTHQYEIQAQMLQDQHALQNALYEQQDGKEHRQALREVLDQQEKAWLELNESIKETRAELQERYERANDPTNKTAQIGDIEQYRYQRRAIRADDKVRLSEHEHIGARINWVLQTLDPETQKSPLDRADYRNMVTLTIPTDMAREKTKIDMELRDKLKEAQKTGIVAQDLVKQMDLEADIERTIKARDATIAARLTEGRAVDDLKAISDEKIIEAAHLQRSELFHIGKTQTSVLPEATEEIHRYIDEQFKKFIS